MHTQLIEVPIYDEGDRVRIIASGAEATVREHDHYLHFLVIELDEEDDCEELVINVHEDSIELIERDDIDVVEVEEASGITSLMMSKLRDMFSIFRI